MTKRIPLFKQLEIETVSNCKHRCPTCLRQTYPDRERVKPWFEHNELPISDILRVFDESLAIGFKGVVCLQHHNEPMLDMRIGEIGREAMARGFPNVFCCTNAWYLKPEIISKIDGCFTSLVVAIYRNKKRQVEIKKNLEKQFKKTRLIFTPGTHIATHYSPMLKPGYIESRQNLPCKAPYHRMIVNHKGEMMLCCDDFVNQYDLGDIYHNTVEELWYSDKHQDLLLKLNTVGGRHVHPNCMQCPR